MKNKQIRGGVCLLLAGIVCFAVPEAVSANATDAVIVEEEVIIGGDMQEEISVPVQSQSVQSQPLQEKQTAAQQSDKSKGKSIKTEKVSANTLPSKTVSENSFVVPRSKSGNTVQKDIQSKLAKKEQKETKEDRGISEEKILNGKTDTVSLPLLLTGVVCLGVGITRFIRRLLVAYGKL